MSIQERMDRMIDSPRPIFFAPSERRFDRNSFNDSAKEADGKLEQLREIGFIFSLEKFIGAEIDPYPQTDESWVDEFIHGTNGKFGIGPWFLDRIFDPETADVLLVIKKEDDDFDPVYIEFNGKALKIRGDGLVSTFDGPIPEEQSLDILEEATAKALVSRWRQETILTDVMPDFRSLFKG